MDEPNYKYLLSKKLDDKKRQDEKRAICKHGHPSPMSNPRRYVLKTKGDKLTLHDLCPKHKFNCQIQTFFTPCQYILEGNGFKKTPRKNFKRSKKAWYNFFKPAVIL